VWRHYSFPVGNYRTEQFPYFTDGWSEDGAGDWSNINAVEFYFSPGGIPANQCDIWWDGLNFQGHVIRGAKKLTLASADEDYYKIKVITDSIGKDDTLTSGTPGTTDAGTMAQLAKAELMRSSRRPITGSISIPGKPTILPGQLAHIHAVAHSAGYRIDKDMRIVQHRLSFTDAGLVSYLQLTDDIINGIPLSPYTAYNLVQQAANPDYQNRQISSIKARDIDITQTILEESYNFNDYY